MRVESWEAETGNNGESGRQREVAVVRVLAWEAETGNGEGGGLGGRDKKW